MLNRTKNEHAVALGTLGGSKGGLARAEAMTPEERQRVAKKAAAARWGTDLPRETHAGTVHVGPIELPCAMLEGERRVLTTQGLMLAFGSSKKSPSRKPEELALPPGSANLPAFLAYGGIYKFVSDELSSALRFPLKFRTINGGTAFAYDAEILPSICEAIADAEKAGELRANTRVGLAARALYKGLARVGIVALVDEATGFQADRARDALATIFEEFISKELRKWVRVFPPEFYEQMFRLKGWTYTPLSVARPGVVAHYTNDIVYARLAPGVLEELKKVTPKNDAGKPKAKLHQSLTGQLGHPRLLEHLAAVTVLMKVSRTWTDFMRHVDQALPRFGDTLNLLPPDDA